MSDFDKEAEREKLRERFAEDEEKRETTEQMSELLLQGATMTNSHCGTCGNPLFRYDGQTFCPTCQRAENDEPTAENGNTGTATDATATANDTPAADEATVPENETMGDSRQIPVDDPRDGTETDPDRAAESQPEATTAATGQPASTPTDDRRAPPSQAHANATASSGDRRSSRDGQSAGSADDLVAAEASLSRTLRRLTNAAEEIDDLGRAREHLAAAHEAAEALDAVRTARK